MQGPFVQPPAWRIVLAFVLTPAIAAFAFACSLSLFGGWRDVSGGLFLVFWAYAAFGAYPPALISGIPALLILRNRVRATPLNSGIVGLIVAAIPYLMLFTFVADSRGDGSLAASLPFIGAVGLAGMLAGLIFWMIAVAGVKRKTPRPT